MGTPPREPGRTWALPHISIKDLAGLPGHLDKTLAIATASTA